MRFSIRSSTCALASLLTLPLAITAEAGQDRWAGGVFQARFTD